MDRDAVIAGIKVKFDELASHADGKRGNDAADAIATRLHDLGITGTRNKSTDCPLAIYINTDRSADELITVFSFGWALTNEVDDSMPLDNIAWPYYKYSNNECYEMALLSFIIRFDGLDGSDSYDGYNVYSYLVRSS